MNLEDRMATVYRRREEQEGPLREQRREEDSKQKLLNAARRKMRTTFIGALARFEEYFGSRIWGHGRPASELTENELAWSKLWEECRADILNHANKQLRALEQEIGEYKVRWEGHHIDFAVGNINRLEEQGNQCQSQTRRNSK